ncbi:hypothetical protein GQ43DRAFT_449238 [Delitschia confertaspora ATCC 74209]|uniref:Ribosomal protein L19 n=1 Tax=Delitschia confertaspora ATCC 74209 TaxID=1513339 RepID=A0A9P4MV59_9PLEO|nr:hypothetical protein GQ43DRAFT_449238 [Delitschia confertaspora ATCC 74209]
MSTERRESPAAPRFPRRSVRTATLILPRTGERVKKSFTLRRAPTDHNGSPNENDPLLSRSSHSAVEDGRFKRMIQRYKNASKNTYTFWTSRAGQNILKCSLAYVLGSLATFVPPISGLLGKNDGKHMVATVTVYFHPARSAGSMAEAIFWAFTAFAYAAFVSFTSMAVSVFFGRQDILIVGHAIVLIVFCGGGLGFVGWLKQKLGNPTVNVACSLASLALITVLTKEGAVQAAQFSYQKIWQVLKMVLMGTIASAAVSVFINPISARKEYRDSVRRVTDSLGTMLTIITRGFLSGSENDLKTKEYVAASNQSKSIFKTMVKNLGEAKYEHYILGTEAQYKIEARLVKCLEQLTQSIGGLRSSAETQFTLLAQSESEAGGKSLQTQHPLSKSSSTFFSDYSSSPSSSPTLSMTERRSSILASIEERPEESSEREDELGNSGMSWRLPHGMLSSVTSADMFSVFIAHLGPPMKSLAYTLREVLDELPFGPEPDYAMPINAHFRSSLLEANELFVTARKEALAAVYKNKAPSKSGSVEIAADFEEVAASCAYFSHSLQDFAEDMITFLDILEELKESINPVQRKRTWNWLKFWRRWGSKPAQDDAVEHGLSQEIPNTLQRNDPIYDLKNSRNENPLRSRLYHMFRILRRDDIKYALKVGIGAVVYAMWSFIPSTRPIFGHWRGEWGLLSYMLVCSMTIGASNTTGFQRFFGTCLGAIYAIIAWIMAFENPFILCFLGWLVSLQCFYIIVGKGKGPMGRFIFLTYNLSALYAYSLSVRDEDDDDDEGGISPEIWEIVLHRVVAVMTGCIWGIIVTRVIWPISARRKVKNGISILWLRMSLIWKRGPLRSLLEGDTVASYMDPHEELEMQRFLAHLDTVRNSASFEFELRGPFPDANFKRILEATGRMLDSFHAMNVIILKDLRASEGEREILEWTKREWMELSWRISHLFSVLASSMKLAYPLNDVLPNIEHARDRLLAKLFEFRRTRKTLVTGQLAQDITIIREEIEQLYGVLNEDDLKLQVNLRTQKRLAASVVGCGKRKIWLDPNEVNEISNANSRQTIRKLVADGLIIRKPVTMHSRARARELNAARRIGRHRGFGKRKGTKDARMPSQVLWMRRLRVLRRLLVKYRAAGKIDKHLYHELYHLSKGNTFKHKRALVEHIHKAKAEKARERVLKEEMDAKRAKTKAARERRQERVTQKRLQMTGEAEEEK